MNVLTKNKLRSVLVALFVLTSLQGHIYAQTTSTGPGSFTEQGHWIPEFVEELKGWEMGPFVRLQDGGVLTIDETESLISHDEGKTWERYSIFNDSEEYAIRPERALLRTSTNVIILAFANDKERANWNWDESISDSPGARLPTYAVRSLDGGKTWETPQKLHDEWTGAIRDIIETNDGNIVFTTMMMRHNPGHHTVLTYTSKDQGTSWLRSNIIDLGGVGHHSGVTESTLVQLHDGRLWMLLRTNWGMLWEVYSTDEGLTWTDVKTTTIDASASPPIISRVASGSLIMVWNRKLPQGAKDYPMVGGDNQWSEVPASVHRQELSIARSTDDGKTWSKPIVIAKCTEMAKYMKLPGGGRDISYPYFFEARPGEFWVTTWRGGLRVKVNEADIK